MALTKAQRHAIRAATNRLHTLQLNNETQSRDPEHNHYEADMALLHLLRELGAGEVADEYDQITPRWYA